jgi:hypothetical protein
LAWSRELLGEAACRDSRFVRYRDENIPELEGLEKRHGLQARNLETLAAARIAAIHVVVNADQVRSGLGKLHAILLGSVSRQGSFLGAPAPANVVTGRLAAEWAREIGRFELVLFAEKIAFFHARSSLEDLNATGL